jgi:DNA-binding NarL/FixJ family response regulator
MCRTVLIVDDNIFIRHALCEFFAREPDFEVCGVAENGREAINEARRLRPDLIVLDLSMPVMNGLDAARTLKHDLPMARLIIYTAFEDRFSEQHMQARALAQVVLKSEKISVLIDKARGLVYQQAA